MTADRPADSVISAGAVARAFGVTPDQLIGVDFEYTAHNGQWYVRRKTDTSRGSPEWLWVGYQDSEEYRRELLADGAPEDDAEELVAALAEAMDRDPIRRPDSGETA